MSWEVLFFLPDALTTNSAVFEDNAVLLLFVFYAIYGISSPFNKLLVSQASPIFLVGIRLGLAGLILVAYRWYSGAQDGKISRQDIGILVKFGFFNSLIPTLFRFWSLQYITSIKLALLYNLAPFITYGFSYALGVEKATKRKSLGLLIGGLGFLPLLLGSDMASSENAFQLSWGEIMVLVAVVSDCYGMILLSRLVKRQHYSPSLVYSITMLGSGLITTTAAFAVEQTLYIKNFLPVLGCLLVSIFASNIFSAYMYSYLLRFYSPTFLSFTDFLRSVFSALYGYLFLHEALTLNFGISTLIIFVGLALFYLEEIQDNKNFLNAPLTLDINWFRDYQHAIIRRFKNVRIFRR